MNDVSYWNERAEQHSREVYDYKHSKTIRYPHYEIRLERLLELLSLHCSNKRSLLDVGCGSGETLVALLEQGWNACGIDFSNKMVAHGQRKANSGWP